jgi:small-conductance mechanosensitive channel
MTRFLSLCGLITLTMAIGFCASPTHVVAQLPAADPAEPAVETDTADKTADRIEVAPDASDDQISTRLERIFAATGWFTETEVRTDEGVVFLNGIADSEEHRERAETIALRTADVVAVVNQLTVRSRSVWEVDPAVEQLRQLGHDFVQMLPLLAVGLIVVFLTYGLSKLASAVSRRLAERKLDSQLLQQVLSSMVAVVVMLVGLYIALKVSGLTRLAVTVLGGTGLLGLAIGFAFRDIAENYLASILISLNRPFSVGDLIELEGHRGLVRRVTTRGTLLLTIDGNHIQIPNNTVYKSVVVNYSSSPRIRKEFSIGIGYDDSVTQAQEIVLTTIENHESVLQDPAPLVLVDSLGAATVNLKVYYWLDGKRFDAASVSSALMRRAKAALFEAGISMPDEAREVIFPDGVPLQIEGGKQSMVVKGEQDASTTVEHRIDRAANQSDTVESIDAEGGLENTAVRIQQHARDAERDDAKNLID